MYTGKDPGSRARGAAPADAFSEGIIIDPGVLHEEKKASSALTDIYGVPLFTDGYEQSVLRAREEDALAREAELDSIFRTVPEGDVYEDTVTSLLFAGTQGQVIREEPLRQGRTLWWACALVVSAVILAALLAGAWYGKEEGRRARVMSMRTGLVFPASLTYQEAGIYQGDSLRLIPSEREGENAREGRKGEENGNRT